MCGITGFAAMGSDRRVPDERVLAQMRGTLYHRGPDGSGAYCDERVGLAMQRLAIIDVAGGQQPIANEDGTILTVFNGEIYNYRELRRELVSAGHRFRTHSDTEVIVHGYEEWGEDFVTRLNGMFAIALYDRRAGKLVLARDHVGIKPLYYAFTRDCLVWGSEIKALLASGLINRDLDIDALGQFMAWEYCPGETTLLRTVRKLLPGHLLVLDLQTAHRAIRRYWSPPLAEEGDRLDDADWIEQVDEALRSAVRRQLVSDVPLGAFLSGGVDSSLITAAMGDALTFSIGFEEDSYNELPYSRLVAEHLGVRHESEIVHPDVLQLFSQLMNFMDDPVADSSIFSTYLVASLARRHVVVALSGDGGDELFAGYEGYQASRLADRYRLVPRALRRFGIEPLIDSLRPTRAKKGLINKAQRFIEGIRHDEAIGHARWRLFLADAARGQLFTGDTLAAMPTPAGDHIEALFGEATARTPLARSLYVDTLSYLPDDILTKVDRMSMAVSLESRVPFLDLEVMELAFRIPDRLKMRDADSKWILRRVAERHLPAAIANRRKEGFSVPLKNWLSGAYRGLLAQLLDPRRIREEGIFELQAVEKLKREHLSGRRNHSHVLWSLMMFQAWQDQWLRRTPPGSAFTSHCGVDAARGADVVG